MFAFVKGKCAKIHVCINNAGYVRLDSLRSGSTEVRCVKKQSFFPCHRLF